MEVHLVVVVQVGELVQLYEAVNVVEREVWLGTIHTLLSHGLVRTIEGKSAIEHIVYHSRRADVFEGLSMDEKEENVLDPAPDNKILIE